MPLRGFCLIAYYSLMRPKNNRALTWEDLTIDPQGRTGRFKLDQHKNVNKGIEARGGLAAELVDYLLSIRPAHASGGVHRNPATGQAYVDIRKQWRRLITIASRLLGYSLNGKKADFFNFRHIGASHIAERARDARHLLAVVKMMGDTSVETVDRRYFNFDDETPGEVIDGWSVPQISLSDDARLRLVS
ncbi:MAG TPA: hypothetical protein VNL91_09875 [Thermoanaerobaculia bacterium]|nr:hypothetical protein [Thermoanaerobaculia bacterium]